jgi:regulatory protein YycI of two-component signal transduction system YycFG
MGYIVEIIVISLLITTIFFCWKLNAKIMELRDSRKDISELVKTFDVAIIKTHKSIADLKTMSANSSQELQSYVNKAGELIEDLAFMTETSARLADRLERAISTARQTTIQYSNNFNTSNSNNNANAAISSSNRERLDKMLQQIGNPSIEEPIAKEADYITRDDVLRESREVFSKSRKDLLSAIKMARQARG